MFTTFNTILKYFIYLNKFWIIKIVFFNSENKSFSVFVKTKIHMFSFTNMLLLQKLQYHILLLRWALVELQIAKCLHLHSIFLLECSFSFLVQA